MDREAGKVPRPRERMQVKVVTRDTETGEIKSRVEPVGPGSNPTVIEHRTIIHGEPTTVTTRPGSETERPTLPEDPLGLRPPRRR